MRNIVAFIYRPCLESLCIQNFRIHHGVMTKDKQNTDLQDTLKAKAIPLHAMKALVGRGGIVATLS
jgi:hypothetical protein